MRTLRLIHAWSGLVIALLVATIAFAGAFTAFRAEFIRQTVPAARAPPPPAYKFGEALTAFEQQQPGEFQSAKFAPYQIGVHRLFLKNGRSAFINARGQVVQAWAAKPRFEEVMIQLHNTLLLGSKGRILAGLVGLTAIFLAITGLILVIPMIDGFPWQMAPASFARRDLLVAHRNLALVMAAFVLLQVTTGVSITFEPEIAKALGVPKSVPPPRTPPAPEGVAVDWQRMMVNAQDRFPGGRIRRAFAPKTENGPYLIYLSPPGDINPEGSAVVYLSWDARVLGEEDARHASPLARTHNAMFALHSGAWGGRWSRYLTALIGLGLGFTALMGALAYVQVLAPRRKRA